MGFNGEIVPAELLRLEVTENESLRMEVQHLQEENKELKRLLVAFKNNAVAVDQMGNYVEGIKHKAFKPAYKEDAGIEEVVKVIYKQKITNLQQIAARMGVSYATIRRRLKADGLYPIDSKAIQTYYNLFCDE